MHSTSAFIDYERNVVMVQWFEKFANTFENTKFRNKVKKPEMFKVFV